MGFFDYLQTGATSAIKSQPPVIRKEVITTNTTRQRPNPQQPVARSTRLVPPRGPLRPSLSSGRSTSLSSSSSTPLKPTTARRKKSTPLPAPLKSSDDDSSGDDSDRPPLKKHKLSTVRQVRNPNRRLRAETKSSGGTDGTSSLVHAAEIAASGSLSRYVAMSDDLPKDLTLQYPSKSLPERYELVRPKDKDDFDPIAEIVEVAQLVPRYYLKEKQADAFLNESSSICRRIKRALSRKSGKDLHAAVAEYNAAIKKHFDQGTFVERLDSIHVLPLPLVEQILTQIYARTVSPRVDSLRKYENGTDNVYGELLPRFVSKIFVETGLMSDKIFVDLGSGVGNVVLQAALEIGCESWGCEVMENACELATLQEREFQARCQLWGLSTGVVHLERGDFLTNALMAQILQRADVVLVNNQAFTPELNDRLTNLFLDLKDGCQVVSLKSFVPHDHKITSRNINSPVNLLEVEMKTYFSNCVSWTNAPGTYFLARKDSRKLKAFMKGRK